MNYSNFVTAVQNDDQKSLKEHYEVLTKVLCKFLLVRMDAAPEDAKDSAQNAIMFAVEKIKTDELNHPDRIINYLFATAKHDYLKHQNKQKEVNYDQVPDSHSEEPDQLENLLTEERKGILEHCFTELKAKQKSFISYWFENPDSEASVVADHFGISINNAWTKKHRIIQVLNECFKKNINK
ncbi:MAG: sigma-70 family RNA polymerase sigma factor [Balneola sp.]